MKKETIFVLGKSVNELMELTKKNSKVPVEYKKRLSFIIDELNLMISDIMYDETYK